MSSFMEKLRAKKAAAAAAANTNSEPEAPAEQPVSAPAVEEQVESQDIEHDAEEAAAALAGHINPPGEAGDVIDVKEEIADQPADHAPAPVPTEAAPKKRGRPAGSKNKPVVSNLEKQLEASVTANEPINAPTVAQVMQRQQDQEAAATYEEAAYKADAQVDGKRPITMLLVDCFVARGNGLLNEVIHASDLIEQAHNHIKSTYNVLDYRAGGAPEIEFGKGPGLLAACIEGLLQDLPRGCVVLLDTRSPEGQVALQPLVAASISVIRGAA